MSDKKFLDLEGLKHFKDRVQVEIDEKAALPTTVNDKYLHTNATTGEYEWVDVTSGGGTVKKVKVNSTEHAPDADGIVDIGTFLTDHQDISGKQDKSSLDTDVGTLGYTKNLGTITGITMNGSSKGTAGVVDLGTVITEHQDITGKQDASTLETDVAAKGFTKNAGTVTGVKVNGTVITDVGGTVDIGNVVMDLGTETGSGEKYHFTYFYDFTPAADKITAHVDTITLDNQKTLKRFSKEIVGATTSTAGLMTATDKTALDAIKVQDVSLMDSGKTLYVTKKDGAVSFSKTPVVDGVASTATDSALSANMGKMLNERIDNLSGMGRYLSTWDCTTGKPGSEPTLPSGTTSYSYKTGDYYIVSKVGTTNYKPTGATYTPGTASTVAEMGIVAVNDTYRFDGTNWVLLHTDIPTTTFSTIAGAPRDNTNLAAEFDKYIKLLPKEPGSGQDYKFPFNINPIVQNADSISTSFDTLVLNDGVTKNTYPIAIPSADIANNKAGLYTKALADAKANASALATEITDRTNAITNEATARSDADTALQTAINTEKTRAEGAESTLTTNLAAEVTRATGAEDTLTADLTAEVTRATDEETRIEGLITTEASTARAAESANATAIANEVTRATGAEGTLTTNLASEVTRATEKEGQLQTAIDGKISLLGNEPTSSQPYHFTYYYGFTPAADKITAYVDTITLDNNKTPQRFTTDIPGATASTAGLLTAADKTKLDGANLKDASVSGTTLTLTRVTGGDVTFTGGPSAFIKSASVSGNTLTLKDQSDTNITFTPINVIDDSTTGSTAKTFSQSKIIQLIEALGGTFFGQFATKAALLAATGMVKNDYAVVTADESQTPTGQTTMYYYTGTAWSFAYVISTTPVQYRTVNGESIVGSTTDIQIINDSATASTENRTYSVKKINELVADKDVTADLTLDMGTGTVSGSIPTSELTRLQNGEGSLIANILVGGSSVGHSRIHLTYVAIASDVMFNGIAWLDISSTGNNFQPLNIYIASDGTVSGGLSTISSAYLAYSSTETYNPGTVGDALNTAVSHVHSSDVHVTSTEKSGWSAKSTVEGKTAKVTGATELKAINIDGTDWNIPEAGIASVSWGDIGGTLSSQTDLKGALDAKAAATDLSDHIGDSDAHTSTTEKAAWNAKVDASTLSAHTTNTGIHVGTDDRTAWNAKLGAGDVINLLTSTEVNKPLSANMGKELKALITALTTRVASLETSVGTLNTDVSTIKANYVKAESS